MRLLVKPFLRFRSRRIRDRTLPAQRRGLSIVSWPAAGQHLYLDGRTS
jgi:hypothetical protein